MTTHKPGTREWAEEQARKGAKVRHESWVAGVWVTIKDGWAIWDYGGKTAPDFTARGGETGWSIYIPAPDDAADAAEIAAAEDALTEFHAKGGKPLEQLGEEVGLGRMAYGETPPGTTGAKPFMVHEEIAALEKRVAALEAVLTPARQFVKGLPTDKICVVACPEDKPCECRDRFLDERLTAAQLPPGTKTIETEEGILVAETWAEPWKPTPGRDAMTRSGKRVMSIFCAKENEIYPIVGWVDGDAESWTRDGKYFEDADGPAALDLIADWPDPAPEFKTTRRMSDPDIIRAGKLTYDSYAYVQNGSHTEGLNEALRAVLNATRQRIRADLEANVDAARLTGFRAADEALRTGREDPYDSAIRAALRKHSEVV